LRRPSFYVLTILGPFILLSSGLTLTVGQTNRSDVLPFTESESNDAVKNEDYQNGTFSFSIGKYQFAVTATGQLSLISPTLRKKVTLDFPSQPLVTSVRYCIYQGDLIINYNFLLDARLQEPDGSLKDGKVEQGRISRLNLRTLKAKWTNINAPSDPPGVPIIAGNSIYVTSVGRIGEIALADGTYLWWHEHLKQANGTRLYVFKVPRVEGQYVFFEEENIGLPRPRYTVQVKRGTGEIITMNYKETLMNFLRRTRGSYTLCRLVSLCRSWSRSTRGGRKVHFGSV